MASTIANELYYGILDIKLTDNSYYEIYSLIYDCFAIDSIFLYPGVQSNEIFFKIDKNELHDLKIKIEKLSPKIMLKEISQNIKTFIISGIIENADTNICKRIEHVAGVSIADVKKNILCCDYQKKLIIKYGTTKYFNESNLIELKNENNNNRNSVKPISDSISKKYLLSDDDDDEDSNYDKLVRNRNSRSLSNNNQSKVDTNISSYSSYGYNSKNNYENFDKYNFRFKNFIELELTSEELPELNVDAVVNHTKYDIIPSLHDSSYSKVLVDKCGSLYLNEISNLKNSNNRDLYRNFESGHVFHTSGGNARNFEYVIHVVTPIGWSLYSNEQKYNELFFIYLNILNYADRTLNLKTIAIQLIDNFIMDYDLNYEINSLAFIQALKQFCGVDDGSNKNHYYEIINSLKKIFVCIGKSAKHKQLYILKNYLNNPNYLNLTLNDINTQNEQPQQQQPQQQQPQQPKQQQQKQQPQQQKQQEKPIEYKSHKPLEQPINNIREISITRKKVFETVEEGCQCGSASNFILINPTDKSNCKVDNCEICKILKNISDIAKKHITSQNISQTNKLCLKCSIDILINVLKEQSICACCYRSGSGNNDVNSICNLHSICNVCLKTQQYGGIECKFCLFNKFSNFLKSLIKNNLFEKHHKIKCSYDFCDLNSYLIDDDNDLPTGELSCGHLSCFSIINPKKSSTSSVCNFCIFKKIFELYYEKFQSDEEDDERRRSSTNSNSNPIMTDDDENFNNNGDDNDNNLRTIFNIERGPQPEGGKMETFILGESLPGYNNYKTILIEYSFPDGVFLDPNSNKAIQYQGKKKIAYLPANNEGNRLCKLLQKAFDYGHVFKLEYSNTYSFYYLKYNNITHKTKKNGEDGYPDDDYLDTLKNELASKGFI